MIKLITNPFKNPDEHTFNTKTVVIGIGEEGEFDLSLPEGPICGKCVQISECDDNSFTIKNLSGDKGLIRCAGNLFTSQAILNGDLITIGEIPILFLQFMESQNEDSASLIEDSIIKEVENILDQEDEDSTFYDSESVEDLLKVIDGLLDKDPAIVDDKGNELDEMLNPFETGYEQQVTPHRADIIKDIDHQVLQGKSNDKKEAILKKKKNILSKVSVILNEPDFEYLDFYNNCKRYMKEIFTKLSKFVSGMLLGHFSKILLAVVIITSAVISYFYVQTKHAKMEIRAAQGLADMSMSLFYTITKHAYDKENISLQVLEDNLSKVLLDPYRKMSSIDQAGQYNFDSYRLSLYSSKDLSNFLLVAKPKSNFADLLYPRRMFVVFSNDFKLKRVNSQKRWSDLLKSSLDNLFESKDLSTSLIHLRSLDIEKAEFCIPEELRKQYPQVENSIYSAPRYYNFATKLFDSYKREIGKSENMYVHIKEFAFPLLAYDNLVLYFTEKQRALHFGALLINLFPQHHFILGYVTLGYDNFINNVQIITDSELAQFIESNPHFAEELQDLIQKSDYNIEFQNFITKVKHATNIFMLQSTSKRGNNFLQQKSFANDVLLSLLKEEVSQGMIKETCCVPFKTLYADDSLCVDYSSDQKQVP